MDSIQVNEQRLVDNFCKLVRIDSSTGMEKLIAEELKRQLADLGAAVREDDAGTTFGGNCGNLIAKIPGTKPGPTLLLSAHMDRVEPGQGINPVITDGIIRSQGDTILAADDVAGIAEILEALRVIKENQLPHVPVEVVFTVAEEGGLKGAKALDTQQLNPPWALCSMAADRWVPSPSRLQLKQELPPPFTVNRLTPELLPKKGSTPLLPPPWL